MTNTIGTYICYMIHHHFQNTYVGITNDFTHRLKQHNGIIKGGAKATKKFEDWTLGYYISGFESKNEVLSFEWHMHHPNGKRKKDSTSKNYYGVCGRIRALCEVLVHDKFEHLSEKLKMHIKDDLYKYIKKIDIELFELLHSFIELNIIE
jgi:predicted GIY-YIG superfamily endonuclease